MLILLLVRLRTIKVLAFLWSRKAALLLILFIFSLRSPKKYLKNNLISEKFSKIFCKLSNKLRQKLVYLVVIFTTTEQTIQFTPDTAHEISNSSKFYRKTKTGYCTTLMKNVCSCDTKFNIEELSQISSLLCSDLMQFRFRFGL